MSASTIDAPVCTPGRAGSPKRLLGMWPWIPLPFGAVYLVVLLAKFNSIVSATYLNADAASAPVIGQLYGGSPAHRQVFLGQMGWFSTLLFELATRWLPAHRQLWELAPYAMALASVALIAWGAYRVAGRWAAAIAGVLLLCAGPHALSLLFSLNDHSTTWFSLALLAAALVFFQAPPSWLRTWSAALLVLALGVIVGVNAASDLVLVAAGLAPLLLAAALVWLLRPARASAVAFGWLFGVVLIAGVFDELTLAYMRHENVLTPSTAVHNGLAAAEALSGNFKLWWQSLMVLGDGNFFGQLLGLTSTLQLICAVLTVLGLGLVLRYAWRLLLGSAPRSRRLGDALALSIGWCAFWGSSAVLLSLSFIFSSNPIDINSSRYLLGVVYAIAALVPLLGLRALVARAAVCACTAAFALTGIVALLDNQATAGATVSYSTLNQLAQLIERERLTVGYANYWDAAPLMWSTHLRVRAYPVQDCAPNICWSYLHMITSWYTTPRPGVRSFLISDPTQAVPSAPMPNLGKPSAVRQVGAITLYIYPYDIATRMQP